MLLNNASVAFPGLSRLSALGTRLAQQNADPVPKEYINPQLTQDQPYPFQSPMQPLTSQPMPAQAPMMPAAQAAPGDLGYGMQQMEAAKAPRPPQGPQEPGMPSPPAISQLRDVMAAHKNLIGTIADIHKQYRGLA